MSAPGRRQAFHERLKARLAAFTLIEISVVLLVLALLAGAASRYALAINDANNIAALNNTLNVIDTALMNYRIANTRLPCPGLITNYENSAAFGTEVESNADGLCTGASFTNSGTDPYASDTNYTNYNNGNSNVVSQVVAGQVPTKALKIEDKYAYDPWGRMILYVVDKRFTIANAFTTYPITTSGLASSPGVIVITSNPSNALANTLSHKAIYVLVSFGENGHGGYVRNQTATPVIFNAGSTNTDELQNCHCSKTAGTNSFDREFVQNPKNRTNGGANSTLFDDVVRYKTRPLMASPAELQ